MLPMKSGLGKSHYSHSHNPISHSSNSQLTMILTLPSVVTHGQDTRVLQPSIWNVV